MVVYSGKVSTYRVLNHLVGSVLIGFQGQSNDKIQWKIYIPAGHSNLYCSETILARSTISPIEIEDSENLHSRLIRGIKPGSKLLYDLFQGAPLALDEEGEWHDVSELGSMFASVMFRPNSSGANSARILLSRIEGESDRGPHEVHLPISVGFWDGSAYELKRMTVRGDGSREAILPIESTGARLFIFLEISDCEI